MHTDQHAASMVVCGTEGECWVLTEYPLPQLPTTPSLGWKHGKGRSGAAESQDGHCHFGSRHQPWTQESSQRLQLETVYSYMQEEEDPLFHGLPLPTLIAWTRWWHLTPKALVLVLKKKVWGTVGSFLRDETGRIDNRIALLRTDWSARGRELHLLDAIRRSV